MEGVNRKRPEGIVFDLGQTTVNDLAFTCHGATSGLKCIQSVSEGLMIHPLAGRSHSGPIAFVRSRDGQSDDDTIALSYELLDSFVVIREG